MKIGVKRVGEELEIIDAKGRYRSEICGEIVGSYCEYVHMGHDYKCCIAVDEAGLPKRLDTNFLIATETQSCPIQKIVGTVVFCRYKCPEPGEIYDLELEDLTEEDIEAINYTIGKDAQTILGKFFKDYDTGIFEVRRPGNE